MKFGLTPSWDCDYLKPRERVTGRERDGQYDAPVSHLLSTRKARGWKERKGRKYRYIHRVVKLKIE